MPPPTSVRLLISDPSWPALAEAEAARIREAVGQFALQIHHIGSTSVAGLAAKPTIDLLGVATSLADLDRAQRMLEGLGYAPHGEFGLKGRRYFTLDSSDTRERKVNLHCFATGDPAIDRHLAFRDYLRARPALVADYERLKRKCAAQHPYDSHAYTNCKDAWIKRVEAEAVATEAGPLAAGSLDETKD